MELDSETGEVVVVERVDREQFSWLNFTVEAMDSGVPPRSSSVAVVVQVGICLYFSSGKVTKINLASLGNSYSFGLNGDGNRWTLPWLSWHMDQTH